jgi:hypothetical protein
MCDLSDFAGQAGRGQVKPKRDADQRMPYTQARIPAQQNDQHTQRSDDRDRKRQLITSLHLSIGKTAMSAPVNHRGMLATPCGVTIGNGRCISHRRRLRLWPARHMHTPGRAGSRSSDVI